jgi:hypothetical protein
MSGAIVPPGHEVTGSASPSASASYVGAVSAKGGIPEWLSPLLQGITLLSVIAVGFAAGAWKGQIDTRLDDILRAREEQRTEVKELTQQVTELGKSISYLQGSLQGSSVPAPAHKP